MNEEDSDKAPRLDRLIKSILSLHPEKFIPNAKHPEMVTSYRIQIEGFQVTVVESPTQQGKRPSISILEGSEQRDTYHYNNGYEAEARHLFDEIHKRRQAWDNGTGWRERFDSALDRLVSGSKSGS